MLQIFIKLLTQYPGPAFQEKEMFGKKKVFKKLS